MNWQSKYKDVSELTGKVLSDVKVNGYEEIIFSCTDGTSYKMYHTQDCCESVTIDDIVGDVSDLIGSEILLAEEVSNDLGKRDDWDESYTWTFYKLATRKGYVDIKWYGTSNGYYSESVDFIQLEGDK